MTEVNGVLGVILAGGLARRMGGGDKGRLDLGGQSLIAEVIARLTPQCDAVIVNANGAAERFADLGLPVIADSLPDYPGPLAGVLAGMDYAANLGLSHVLSAAADTPFLPQDLRAQLEAIAGAEGKPIALAATREGERLIRQPTFGLWPVALRGDLRAALGQGVSKIVLWAGQHGMAFAPFEPVPVDPFFNVNTPEDLELARSIWHKLSKH